MGILKVPKPLQGVSGGKAPSMEDSMQSAKNVISKQEAQLTAIVGCETLKKKANSQGTDPRTLSQTARDETQVPVSRSHFVEEEFQENEEDFINILEEETSALVRSGNVALSNGNEPQWIIKKEDYMNVREGGSREKKQMRGAMLEQNGQIVGPFQAEKETFEDTKRRCRRSVEEDRNVML